MVEYFFIYSDNIKLKCFMEANIMRKNKWALILFLLYVTGFVLYFLPRFRDVGAGILIGAIVLHVLYTFSPHQRAAVSMLNARRMTEIGNLEKAYQYIKQYLKLSSDKMLIGYLLSTSKKTSKYYEALASMLEKELEESDTPILRYLIASIYYSINNLDKTAEILKGIPEKDMDIETVRLLGTALLEKKDFSEAIAVFKSKEKREGTPIPEELNILLGLGLTYAEKGDTEKAEQYYRRVQKFNPSFPGLSALKKKIFPDEEN
jgi:tetratricopeptide (TPR) repeat protein